MVRMFELDDEVVARLRDRLSEVGYTVDGVQRQLGPVAHAALHRNETTPGLRETDDGGPLATLVRLWLLQASVPRSRVADALPELLEPLVAAGILYGRGDEVCALVDLRPYGQTDARSEQDWWVAADLTPGLDGVRPTVEPDHVLGVNSAATTLAQLTVRNRVDRALDLGTGCGIQALHLSRHARQVVATDVNPRALALARLTARLNGLEVRGPGESSGPSRPSDGGVRSPGPGAPPTLHLREGSLFEPVQGERFDLVVSNPPFVVSPRGDLAYRDSGLAGDEFCRRLVVEAPRHLTEGGVCQILANWLHIRGEDWRDRLNTWLVRAGCDAWVIQREVADPAQYIEVWLKDAGLHGTPGYRERYDEWLGWFEAQNAEAIGMGWIILRRPDRSVRPERRHVRLEEWTTTVAQPLGPEVSRWLAAVDQLRALDDRALLALRPRVAEHVDFEQIGRPGAADPEHLVLRQRAGLCRAERVDTAEAGFVGACDGTLTTGQIIDALATLLGEDEVTLRTRLLPRVRQFVEEGYLSLPDVASALS
ncbi:methyltransferase family protein [Thermasporomyces composti]|jgi:methylase of polypeptide subunit release factors|uniref:Methyltransferase family protein n=2 Tax=Thermasporomyces composti TaxID=696763 RepID=A0A3D9V535_THECX|nr:methyltransferase family protein [Thermasporomyces composti]